MKKSILKNIIKEEIRSVLKEVFYTSDIPKNPLNSLYFGLKDSGMTPSWSLNKDFIRIKDYMIHLTDKGTYIIQNADAKTPTDKIKYTSPLFGNEMNKDRNQKDGIEYVIGWLKRN